MWAPVALLIMGVKLKVEGLEYLQRGQHYVIMANHSSYSDIPLLFHSLPFNIHFVGKKELKKVPFLGWYMAISGMIFIDRSNPKKGKESIEKAIDLVKDGFNVVIFPEGTTSTNGEIAAFKKGGFVMARESETPILPIRIIGSNIVWPSDSLKTLVSHEVIVKIGEPLDHEEYSKDTVKSNMVAIRELIIGMDSNRSL